MEDMKIIKLLQKLGILIKQRTHKLWQSKRKVKTKMKEYLHPSKSERSVKKQSKI